MVTRKPAKRRKPVKRRREEPEVRKHNHLKTRISAFPWSRLE